jgi:hypothetical protein
MPGFVRLLRSASSALVRRLKRLDATHAFIVMGAHVAVPLALSILLLIAILSPTILNDINKLGRLHGAEMARGASAEDTAKALAPVVGAYMQLMNIPPLPDRAFVTAGVLAPVVLFLAIFLAAALAGPGTVREVKTELLLLVATYGIVFVTQLFFIYLVVFKYIPHHDFLPGVGRPCDGDGTPNLLGIMLGTDLPDDKASGEPASTSNISKLSSLLDLSGMPLLPTSPPTADIGDTVTTTTTTSTTTRGSGRDPQLAAALMKAWTPAEAPAPAVASPPPTGPETSVAQLAEALKRWGAQIQESMS